VHYKACGETPPGMDAETAALFPDSFEDSELGLIPCGWGVGTISDLADMDRISINPGNFSEEMFWHYSLPAYDEGRMPKLEYGWEIKSNKYRLPDGCVLLSKLNPQNMKVWLPMPYDDYSAIASTEFLVMMAQNYFSREYIYSLFTTDAFARIFSNLVTGTSSSHQRVKPAYLMGIDAVLPPQLLVELFTAITRPLYQAVLNNQDESRTLAETRDALLPRLVSGEIRVGEVGF
jgi:type I restriction enzyme S subunit